MDKKFSDRITEFRKNELPILLKKYSHGFIYLQINQPCNEYYATKEKLLEIYPNAYKEYFGNHYNPINILEEQYITHKVEKA
jgi:hypothetical protein